MAKLLSIEGTLSGSLNGITYSHNKGGAYKRARKVPTISASAKAAFAKALLGTISTAWTGLTTLQKTEWNDRGQTVPVIDVLGQSINLSGQQMFIALNARLLGSGQAIATSPPAGTGPPQLLTAVVTPSAGNHLSIAFTPPLPAGGSFCCWMTLPGSPGQDPNQNQARLVGYTAPDAATPAVFTTPYPFVTGQQFNCYLTVMDAAGRVAPRIKARVTVP